MRKTLKGTTFIASYLKNKSVFLIVGVFTVQKMCARQSSLRVKDSPLFIIQTVLAASIMRGVFLTTCTQTTSTDRACFSHQMPTGEQIVQKYNDSRKLTATPGMELFGGLSVTMLCPTLGQLGKMNREIPSESYCIIFLAETTSTMTSTVRMTSMTAGSILTLSLENGWRTTRSRSSVSSRSIVKLS